MLNFETFFKLYTTHFGRSKTKAIQKYKKALVYFGSETNKEIINLVDDSSEDLNNSTNNINNLSRKRKRDNNTNNNNTNELKNSTYEEFNKNFTPEEEQQLQTFLTNFQQKTITFSDDFSSIITKDIIELVLDQNEELESDIIDLYLLTILNQSEYYLVSSATYDPLMKIDYKTSEIINLLGPKQDESNIQKILIPVNFEANHWLLFELQKNSTTIKVYDSLKQSSSNNYKKQLNDFFNAIRIKFFHVGTMNDTLRYEVIRAPQQRDYVNCGIFTIMFIENLIKGTNIFENVRKFNLLNMRKRLLLTISSIL